ncbi:unnamed protein product [Cladocopium goreaui]|uniref:Poly(U)-specific endoribonuclease-B (Protei n endoU-B) (Uridylate-specific endoribonuclease-B) (XendoU-B) n=1 Tax=Cladocopium goreaui TaxID=2562237 RepID=A0A9P1FY68_9DINO|nr:unnamed protein product [Cladocopium goreaui]
MKIYKQTSSNCNSMVSSNRTSTEHVHHHKFAVVISLMVRPCLRSLARRRATAASLVVFGLGCSFADLGCENVSAPLMPAVPDLRPIGTLLTSPPSASVSADPVATFALGTLVGAVMGFLSLFVVFTSFLRNLQTDELDGAKWGSFGGLVMPSFFFQGASDIYNNVRRGADEARRTFQDTGRFEDIYVGIEEAQKEQVLQGLDALRERFPRSKSRERIFERLKGIANNSRFAASIYDLALRLQPPVPAVFDICSELWLLDENRCSVSGRQPGEGRRPWVNGNAQILIDTQVPASRLTDATMAHRPLFARVAPEILAKPTLLCLVKLFDIFQHLDHDHATFSKAEEAVDDFIKIVARTAVMRRAFRYAVDTLGLDLDESDESQDSSHSWQKQIREVWFTRAGGRPCAFEHIFVGNLSEDSDGHPVAGGLHCWLKFYLEELRGTARYLGYFYNRSPKEALQDHRYISGKFIWEHAGRNLVKEGGGFFVGVSPEWLLADGTIAFLETRDADKAQLYGWQPWLGARDRGYTKDVVHEGFRYRKVVCHSEQTLITVFSSFLGVGFDDESEYTAHLDRILSEKDLATELPGILVSEGIAKAEDSELCAASVRFCASRHCHSLGEALHEIRGIFGFSLEATMEEAESDANLKELVFDAAEMVKRLSVEEASLSSATLPLLVDHLKQQGRSGARLHRPLRLLLTGHPNGAKVADLICLLELADREGGDETGPSLSERLQIAKELLGSGILGSLMAKADVRKLFKWLGDYVDLPQDFQRSRTWENCLYDLEMDLKGISAVNAGKDLPSVEPVAHLMNFRDAVISLMLQSLLFKKAVLDWDLKSERAYADGPMVAMSELAVNIFSKTESLPYKFRPPALPKINGPGPFTKRPDEKSQRSTAGLTSLQCHLLAVLREMQSMGKGLRNMDFAEKVHMCEDETGQNPAADELGQEMAKWFERCTQLERELHSNKGERENQMESKVEELERSVTVKETANKKLVTSIHKLEGEVQSLRYEFVALQRERSEVTEQNNRIAKESLPVIEKMRTLVDRSKEATERLTKDSAILSRTFRRQVQETERIIAEKENISKELERAKRQLQTEKEKNEIKEVELQKKETLYLRTMAARKSIQDSFNEQREQIAKVEASMERMEVDRQELLKVIQGKDGHIRELEEDLRRAKKRIAEMEQQRDMALQEFRDETGRILDLSSFKVAPTLS